MKYSLLLVLLFVISCGEHIPLSGKEGELIPSVNLLLMDSSSVINTRTVYKSGPTVLFFFSPYCPYCRHETESILKSINKFKNVQICFLSVSSLNEVRDFSRNYKLTQYSNIQIGVDTAASYLKYFSIDHVPHTSIYLHDMRLRRVFSGGVDADKILSIINDN
ncbi:redoxin domain-containing protein [Chitinophaga sp.]|uniref:peroxiredoxin family protein n=1 Tax=Chitinophaga sp. TaxID=1869181 RepID=UPI0031D9016F